MMNEELNLLRDQIDVVDKQLVALLAERLKLVAGVGEVKSRHGLPIYAPDREAAMLAKRREEAAAAGVPPALIEDVLRRVMRESYSSEKDSGFKCVNPQLRSVVVIGGRGQLGSLFAHMFTLSGYKGGSRCPEGCPVGDPAHGGVTPPVGRGRGGRRPGVLHDECRTPL